MPKIKETISNRIIERNQTGQIVKQQYFVGTDMTRPVKTFYICHNFIEGDKNRLEAAGRFGTLSEAREHIGIKYSPPTIPKGNKTNTGGHIAHQTGRR